MKTTIDLPDPLVRRVRAVAREHGVTMRELMVDGLYNELERWERSEAETPPERDFPVFDGRGLRPDVDVTEMVELSYGPPR